MTDTSHTKQTTCSSCGTQGSGRFCSNCGAHLAGASCTECGTRLVTGARYCHGCGATMAKRTAGSAPAAPRRAPAPAGGLTRNMPPWGIAGLLGLTAFSVFALAWAWGSSRNDGSQTVVATPVDNGTSTRPPDIASMTPRERAERLYDRAMIAKESGKTDSATFFATMAVQAYEALSDKTLDDRYDLGRLALVAGNLPRARAESDTILTARPTHLLGLILSEDVALAAGDAARAGAAHRKLLEVAAAERQVALPEYASHARELTAALARPAAPGPPPRK